jgi:putative DNA primase/helicase
VEAISFTPAEIRAYFATRVPHIRQTTRSEWRGPCPIHKGKDDNFAVDRDTGRWFCHSQCQRGGDVISLEMELSGADFKQGRDEAFRIAGRAVDAPATPWEKTYYIYDDEKGQPAFRIVRRERSAGLEREKKFHLERREGNRWIKGLKNTQLVPFHLPQVIAAEQVFVCEGEKDASTIEQWGLVGTTAPFGAGKWREDYSKYVAGKHVVILVDNDDAGRKHAYDVASSTFPAAASTRILELPGLPPKGDVTDWKSSGGSREELLRLVDSLDALSTSTLADLRHRWNPAPLGEATPLPMAAAHFPFHVTDDGIFFVKENDDGSSAPVRIAARIDVMAKTRDSSGNNWGRLLRWKDYEGHVHLWAMPMELLATDAAAIRARLLSEGLPFITTNLRLKDRLTEYLQSAPADELMLCVSRVGWHGSSFVLPDATLGPDQAGTVLYQTPHDVAHHWNVRGDSRTWKETVGKLCSGNSRLILAVSAAFAGPLLVLGNQESGGLHIYGGSSTGKTTALIVGGSVCGGGGQSGFIQTWRSTGNALEALAESHNDGTLFLDELVQADGEEAIEIAYLLANGQGKARMTRTMAQRPRSRWNVIVVSTGEMTLAEHAAASGARARGGADVRFLNVDEDAGANLGIFENLHGAPSADVFARQLKDGALQCYGSPFRAFVERIVSHRAEVEEIVRKVRERFVRQVVPAGACGESIRAAERFALFAAAGELATEWGLTGWEEGESIKAAERCYSEWARTRAAGGRSFDVEAAIAQVKAFIETKSASRFPTLSGGQITREGERIIDRAGFRRLKDGGEIEYVIFREIFKSEICRGHSHRMVLKELDRRGFLVREEAWSMTVKRRLPDLGLIRVYCIRAEFLESDDPDTPSETRDKSERSEQL